MRAKKLKHFDENFRGDIYLMTDLIETVRNGQYFIYITAQSQMQSCALDKEIRVSYNYRIIIGNIIQL